MSLAELSAEWSQGYEADSIYLVTSLLPPKAEHIQLFKQFLERFGERSIACLSADREFLGKAWFSYLLDDPSTPLRIRIRKNHKLSNADSSLKVSVLFANVQVGQTKILCHKRLLWGHWLYIAALRVAALLLSALPAVSQPLPSGDNSPVNVQTTPREAGFEFEGFGTPNIGRINDIVYQGECPGEDQGALRARFYSTTTPPGPGLRVVIRNMSRGLAGDQIPFTDRDYSKGRTSESTSVEFGTKHRLTHFVMLEGENDLEYEIKQGDRSIERGTFIVELSRGEKRSNRNAFCSTEQYCRGSEDTPLDKCKNVRTRTRCSCPDGSTFIRSGRGSLVKLCRARFN